MKMDIRDLISRLEKIETEARDKREHDVEDSVGRLIEDLIEEDLENERVFAKQISKYIDEKIENEIVAQAVKNGTIAKA
jgi:N-glycosylase/DNA lyase